MKKLILLVGLLWSLSAGAALHGVGGIPGGGSGCTDGNKGDVTVSAGCTSFVVTGGSAIDNLFTFIDNLDATRRGQFDASIAPVGTTVYRMPSAAGTLARLEDIPQFQTGNGNYTSTVCGVAYNGTGFQYSVSACNYVIDGTPYTSPPATVTLAAADPTNDRIDIIAVNTSSIATMITGTPAVNPQAPDVDPSTQLQLTFVYVTAAATTPGTVQTAQYRENAGTPTEWTYSDNTANLDPNNTAQPYAGTKDIGATAVVAGNQFLLTNGSTIDLSQQNYFVFRLRPNGTWPAAKNLRIQWLNGATALGSFVSVSNGTYGLNTASATYQLIAIPVSSFNLNGQVIDSVRVRVQGAGAAFAFYIDNVELQSGVAPPPAASATMVYVGDWVISNTYSPQQVVRLNGQTYVAIAANIGSTPTYADTNANWRRLKADETTTTLGALIDGATGKTTPVDADELPLADSAASFIVKKLTWANLKATLKTYFDTLYQAAPGTQPANTVYAGPAAGGAATPTFRSLVVADGTGVFQGFDATLTALAGANWAANALPIGTGADTLSQTSFAANTFPARASTGNLVAKTITDFGLSQADDADAAAGRTTLGGTTVGGNIFTLTNPSAITYVKIAADNTVTAVAASVVATDAQGTGLASDTAGFRGIPQNSQSGNYTTVATDAGKHILHPSGAGAGDTITIDSNANVATAIGTAITFMNMDSNAVSIAITSDTLTLCGTGATGTRTLAQYGVWTVVKITSTSWLGCGTGAT